MELASASSSCAAVGRRGKGRLSLTLSPHGLGPPPILTKDGSEEHRGKEEQSHRGIVRSGETGEGGKRRRRGGTESARADDGRCFTKDEKSQGREIEDGGSIPSVRGGPSRYYICELLWAWQVFVPGIGTSSRARPSPLPRSPGNDDLHDPGFHLAKLVRNIYARHPDLADSTSKYRLARDHIIYG